MSSPKKTGAEQRHKSYAEFQRSKEHYPIVAHPMKHHPDIDDVRDTVILCDLCEDDADKGMMLDAVMQTKKKLGLSDSDIKKSTVVIPRMLASKPRFEKLAREYPFTVMTMPQAKAKNIKGAVYINPPTSQRNAAGKGRYNIYAAKLLSIEVLQDPARYHLIVTRNNWWINGNDDARFRQKIKPQLVSMISLDYGGKDQIWGNWLQKSHDGDTKVIDRHGSEVDRDYRITDHIIHTGNSILDGIIYNCRTKNQYKIKGSRNCISSKNAQKSIIGKSKGCKFIYEVSVKPKLAPSGEIVLEKSYQTGLSHLVSYDNEPDLDKWKIVMPQTGRIYGNHLRLSGVIVPPGICIPRSTYLYLAFETKEEAQEHLNHLESPLVNAIIDHTRLGRTISTTQLQYVPHLEELQQVLKRLTPEQKAYLRKLNKTNYSIQCNEADRVNTNKKKP